MRRPRLLRTRLLPTKLPLACLLPVLLASAPLAAQQVYKWKDASGVTHFSSEPPPDRPYEAREIDHHQAVPAAAGTEAGSGDAPAAQPGHDEDPACTSARGRLALLEGKAQLMADSDGDGKPDKPLADADREKQRALAAAIIAVKCDGPPPAQDAPKQAAEPEEQ
jgi:hypothetical protein